MIETLDHVIEGARAGGPVVFFTKGQAAQELAMRWHSYWSVPGIPGVGVAPLSLNGEVLVSPVAGQLPFRHPGGAAKCYLGRFLAQTPNIGAIMLCDRLWHNVVNAASTSLQAITSPQWPARDNNGTIDGEGVLLGVETYGVMGAGVPTLIAYYTSSAGSTNRSSNNTHATTSAAGAQGFYPMGLQAFDQGVKAVSGFQMTATWTSGSFGLVAYRPLAYLTFGSGGAFPADINALSGALVELFPGTVPFLLHQPGSTASGAAMHGGINYLHR